MSSIYCDEVVFSVQRPGLDAPFAAFANLVPVISLDGLKGACLKGVGKSRVNPVGGGFPLQKDRDVLQFGRVALGIRVRAFDEPARILRLPVG